VSDCSDAVEDTSDQQLLPSTSLLVHRYRLETGLRRDTKIEVLERTNPPLFHTLFDSAVSIAVDTYRICEILRLCLTNATLLCVEFCNFEQCHISNNTLSFRPTTKLVLFDLQGFYFH
jgi:hypothetical protein